MNYLSRYKKRINCKGNTIQERIIREQHDNFYKYLDRTPQQEKIIIDDKEYIVSILTRKTSEKEKFFQILAPLEVPLKQGVLIQWNKAVWLVVISEDQRHETHFRGELKKCNNILKWVDDFGVERNTHVYIKGNVSGDLQYQTSSTGFGSTFAFVYGAISADIEVILPINKYTQILNEQKQFILNNKKWELVDKDDFSYEGIIGVLLKRNMKSTITDDLEAGIANAIDLNTWRITVENGYTYSIVPGAEQEIKINIYHKDNIVVLDKPKLNYTIDNPSIISFNENIITGLAFGDAKLKIFIDSCPEVFCEINITVEQLTEFNTHYSIEGNAVIKEGSRKYEYVARRTYNGDDDITAEFKFSVRDPHGLVRIARKNRNTCIVLTNCQSKYGDITLIADDGLAPQTKTITIESVI